MTNYEQTLAMAGVFEKKLDEAEKNLANLIQSEADIANRIEDTSRIILAMRRTLATLRSGIRDEPAPAPVMPQATGLRDLTREIERDELAGKHFLSAEEAERLMAENQTQE